MQRFLLYFGVVVLVTLGSAATLSYLFEPLNGDLTRIGRYSEMDYGWNNAQPVIKIRENGDSIVDPDILVLGDSFSKENVWQSILGSRLNKSILSFHYAQVGCVNNWIQYALNHTRAATIVIEVVERSVVERFADLPNCAVAPPAPLHLPSRTSAEKRPNWPPELHIFHSFGTAINTVRVILNPDSAVRGKTINAPVRDHCANFSNRRPDRVLYYPDDENKLLWDRSQLRRAIANIIQIQRLFESRGKNLVFIIVPDKLSVYQDCIVNDPDGVARKQINITRTLIEEGSNTPDLMAAFKENAGDIIDLYYPNNTHLSTRGYALMAERAKNISQNNEEFALKAIGPPPARTTADVS